MTNAFAEAPPPAAKLYVEIDALCRNWHTKHRRLGSIPENYVLPVNQALQGHPESPRLWAMHIHSILLKLGFKSCPHEPCLYSGTFRGQQMLILWQVDDFAIACQEKSNSIALLDRLDSILKQKVKRQGLLSAFNELDVEQTSLFTKISCSRYLTKILDGHGWLTQSASHVSTPITNDPSILKEYTISYGPTDSISIAKLQMEMGFRYR